MFIDHKNKVILDNVVNFGNNDKQFPTEKKCDFVDKFLFSSFRDIVINDDEITTFSLQEPKGFDLAVVTAGTNNGRPYSTTYAKKTFDGLDYYIEFDSILLSGAARVVSISIGGNLISLWKYFYTDHYRLGPFTSSTADNRVYFYWDGTSTFDIQLRNFEIIKA